MQNIQQIVNYLIAKKAKENNTIDLNAYAIGALDALEKSNYTEMLEMLKDIKDYLGSDIRMKVDKLIKEATEL